MLTPTHLFTFKEEKKYKNPTEIVVIKDCSQVKSADEEVYKENSLVKKVRFHN